VNAQTWRILNWWLRALAWISWALVLVLTLLHGWSGASWAWAAYLVVWPVLMLTDIGRRRAEGLAEQPTAERGRELGERDTPSL
jgi:hypothetical protein